MARLWHLYRNIEYYIECNNNQNKNKRWSGPLNVAPLKKVFSKTIKCGPFFIFYFIFFWLMWTPIWSLKIILIPIFRWESRAWPVCGGVGLGVFLWDGHAGAGFASSNCQSHPQNKLILDPKEKEKRVL